jgi:hypothetical protein
MRDAYRGVRRHAYEGEFVSKRLAHERISPIEQRFISAAPEPDQRETCRSEPKPCSNFPESFRKASIRSWQFAGPGPWPRSDHIPRRTDRMGDEILTSPIMRPKTKTGHSRFQTRPLDDRFHETCIMERMG